MSRKVIELQTLFDLAVKEIDSHELHCNAAQDIDADEASVLVEEIKRTHSSLIDTYKKLLVVIDDEAKAECEGKYHVAIQSYIKLIALLKKKLPVEHHESEPSSTKDEQLEIIRSQISLIDFRFNQIAKLRSESIINETEFDVVILKHHLKTINNLLETRTIAVTKALTLSNNDHRQHLMTGMMTFDTLFNETLSWLTSEIDSLSPHITTEVINHNGGGQNFKMKRFEVPEFDGSLDKWVKFKAMFQSLIHNNSSVSKIEKFHYLEQALKLPSQQNPIASITISDDNYEDAWKSVCDRFDNRSRLINHHLTMLFNVKKMKSYTAVELRSLLDSCNSNLNALAKFNFKLENKDDLANLFVVHMVEHRLVDELLLDWQEDLDADTATWQQLNDFLSKKQTNLNIVNAKKTSTGKLESEKKPPQVKVQAQAQKTFTTSNSYEIKCILCAESHRLWACPQFKAMNADQRQAAVREKRACFNCFSTAHQSRDCTSQHRCKIAGCNRKHHTTLHQNQPSAPSSQSTTQHQPRPSMNPPPQSTLPPPFVPATSHSNASMTAQSHDGVTHEVLLSTAVVWVADGNGHWRSCRALLDSGSQCNYMTISCANRLNLPRRSFSGKTYGIGGSEAATHFKVSTSIASKCSNYQAAVEFPLLDDITGFLPTRVIAAHKIVVPPSHQLADPEYFTPAPIDMLLGKIVDSDIKMDGKLYLTGGPVLENTALGWTIGGSAPVVTSRNANSLLSCFKIFFNRETLDDEVREIGDKLDRFFSAEDIESTNTIYSPEEKYCEDLYATTTTRGDDGKFICYMPMKISTTALGTNFSNSMQMMHIMDARRKRDPTFDRLYADYMSSMINDGYISEVSSNNISSSHYLPHHGVLKMSSTSTKLRPVFNASKTTETGISLNDVLCKGPTVQPELIDLLIRVRETNYLLTGDLTKMYLQVQIHPSQRHLLRMLWKTKIDDQVRHFEANTATFGTACAPFLATRSVVQAAIEHEATFPQAAAIIKRSFYVDDWLFGVDSIDEGVRLRDEIRHILSSVGMNLCKFGSNNAQLLKGLPPTHIEANPEDETCVTKILGIGFHPSSDTFHYQLSQPKPSKKITKAKVLSDIASIYDPIGWIGPMILTAKLFMKKLWSSQLDWKDELPHDLQVEWNEFQQQIVSINSIKIPRHCFVTNHVTVELHGFCDASILAYGSVIYAVSRDELNNTQTTLICSKSRVSPKHQKTLARLELCSATLIAKLMNRTRQTFTAPISEIYYWSDSTIALCWIRLNPSRLSTFVGNRVAVVQELTHGCTWRHIKGSDNPADIISRGLMPAELEDSTMWWNGPSFLQLNKSQWPQSILTINEKDPEVTEEMKRVHVATVRDDFIMLIENRFSNHHQLVNTIAYCQRFVSKLRCRNSFSSVVVPPTGKKIENLVPKLTAEEKENSEKFIIKSLQQFFFNTEKQALEKQVENETLFLPKTSHIRSLSPFLHEGIIRVGGRISEATQLTFEQKHPILLPHCHFAAMIIRDLHMKHLHPGNSLLLSLVREKFWILRARDTIKKVTLNCLICFKVKPRETNPQMMSNLPSARVNMSPPFTCTALDYTGFFLIRSSFTNPRATHTKSYVAMFKCMCTGAIHLELVPDLTTTKFLEALCRFTSTRGLCKEIFSDNATCFQSADTELKSTIHQMNPEMKKFCEENQIKWNFTTPRAPHAGGIYESGIKSAKHFLKRNLTEKVGTYDELLTLLKRIEAMLNSRPLVPMSDDPNDFNVITPGHFLIGRPLVAQPEKTHLDAPKSALNHYRGLQKLQQQFWQSWHKDYLHQLQQRPKKFQEIENYYVGQLVLLKDSNLPPMKWSTARITRLYPNRKDHVVRNVEILTSNQKKFDRHVNYLIPLPIEETRDSLSSHVNTN